jgi:hypothetical protein
VASEALKKCWIRKQIYDTATCLVRNDEMIEDFTRVDNGRIIKEESSFIPRGVNFSEPWLCSRKDVVWCASTGANAIRLWCKEADWLLEQSGNGRVPSSIRMMAGWARDHGIALMPTLGEMSHAPCWRLRPWNDPALAERFLTFWSSLANVLMTDRMLLGFEIMSEPQLDVADIPAYVAFCNSMINAIREVDPNHALAIPCQGILSGDHAWDSVVPINQNTFITFSFYDPYQVTHTNPPTDWPLPGMDETRMAHMLDNAALFAARNNVPVVCSEFGCLRQAPGQAETRWVATFTRLCNEREIGWMYWGYKGFRSTSFHLFGNAVDRGLPTKMIPWGEMISTVAAGFRT